MPKQTAAQKEEARARAARDRNPVVLVDIDGTLALRGDRDPHDHMASMEDAVNWPVVKLCEQLSHAHRILLVSGRSSKYRSVTEYWLWRHGLMDLLNYSSLCMRAEGDDRPDDECKQDMYERIIEPFYGKPFLVLDDRNKVVKMWRELGLTCLQVAEGDF